MSASEPLVCPSCATPHPLEDRFCRDCGMPLVYAGSLGVDAPVTERQEWARKIKPQLAEGELTKVAAGRNQAEAELIQGLLLEEGVPSMLKRSAGFDVPDMLAAGPRDVLVPRSGVEVARDVLMQADLLPSGDGGTGVDRPSRILLGLLSAFVLVALIAWFGTELLV
ncbi:MAG: zinc ribbon protein [Conexibacter sp.]|nr:zinc ribbon protein [Conexibacter sp.]